MLRASSTLTTSQTCQASMEDTSSSLAALTSSAGSTSPVYSSRVGLDDEIVAVSTNGITIRLSVRDISSQGRDATGVRVMNIDDGDAVGSVAPILATDS